MIATKYALWASGSLSILCLIVGFGMVGYWEIVLTIPAILIAWNFTRKVARQVVLSNLLVIYVFLAALGSLNKISPYLMLIGCSSALVCWESALFSQRMNIGNGSLHQDSQSFEMLHLRDLFSMTSIGLLLGLMGLNVHMQLPFGVVAGLALLAVIGFYQGLRYLVK